MSAGATTARSPRPPWSSPSHAQPISSTTPAGFPGRPPGSTGPPIPSGSITTLSPHPQRDLTASSPNYFEYITDPGSNPPNSNAGFHARRNWVNASPADRSEIATPSQTQPLEAQKRFENFRRQSETNTFNLNHGNLRQFSTGPASPKSVSGKVPPIGIDGGQGTKTVDSLMQPQDERNDAKGKDEMDIDPLSGTRQVNQHPLDSPRQTILDRPPMQSPANSLADLAALPRDQDDRHVRNSLPNNRPSPLPITVQRAETLPSTMSTDGPTMISPQDAVRLIKDHSPYDFLVLDLRVFAQYSKSRIHGALNLCIPTTLLKRPSYNVKKLADTFSNKKEEQVKFNSWGDVKFIVVYDAASAQLKDATSCANTLKKFTNENWEGATFILRGGFNAFSKKFSEQVDERPAGEVDGSSAKKLSIEPPSAAPVAGGCTMPVTQTAANPFFGTIRQNMDLIDGVGQMPVKLPSSLKEDAMVELPAWLREGSDSNDKGKTVADRFLRIEKTEQQRMQKALSSKVSYGSPNPLSPNSVQVAGIEKGNKNRYKDVLPFDHSRVRLQNVPPGGCDYVNASYIKAERSNRRYIASQAPIPATFPDFWRVAWEHNARVIVMLTAETDGGHRKCHPYWIPGDYGPFKLKAISEKRVPLDLSKEKPNRSFTSPLQLDAKFQRPDQLRRRSTNYTAATKDIPTPPPPGDPNSNTEPPFTIVRKLTLTHTAYPFEPLHEITQIQYSSWPDFGAPAHPAHVLALVEYCDSIIRSYQTHPHSRSAEEPASDDEHPIVVHCSAGCGRTGTFCTVDSVIDMMKRQRRHRRVIAQAADGMHDPMDVDAEKNWLESDERDLVADTVENFRLQRVSMVQTLRQFVLCYESVLEWVAREMPEKAREGSGGDSRRSWAG